MASSKLNLPGIRQEQRKNLPYSIKDIGGKEALESWKAMQVTKEQDWQREKQLKLDLHITQLQNAQDKNLIYIGKQAALSPTKAWARYHDFIKEEKPKFNYYPKVQVIHPWHVRLKDFLINWFLDINKHL